MELDPTKPPGTEQTDEEEDKEKDEQRKRFNTLVAITVALIATFMAVTNVKDSNIRDAMLANTADQVERWAIVQSVDTRAEISGATADRLRLEARLVPSDQRQAWLDRAAAYDKMAQRQLDDIEEVRKLIEEDQRQNRRWQMQHEKFDLSHAVLSIAIAMLAISALIQVRWLYWLTLIPTAFGVLMGLAGFFNWPIEPESLVRFLGA